MSDRDAAEADITKFGLLMESAQAHQKLAESHLERLRTHTQDLDGVVRDEIRRTLVEELRELSAESDRASRALRAMKHAANMRGVAWTLGITLASAAIPAAIARYFLPTAADVNALRMQRDALAQEVANLQLRGGKIEWRNCGNPPRLCVRVDRKAPVYGDQADYYVAKGY